MKKSFYLVGSMLAIVLIGIVLFSGCTRNTGTSGGSAVNSNTTSQQSTSSSAANSNGAAKATVSDGVQTVSTTLDRGYTPIVVQTGIPVKWTITAKNGDLSGCNNKMLINSYGVEQKLSVGENVVEFTPTKSGTIPYSCWMGMVGSTITVADDINQ